MVHRLYLHCPLAEKSRHKRLQYGAEEDFDRFHRYGTSMSNRDIGATEMIVFDAS